MDKLLDEFLEFLEITKKLSKNTLESYKRDISQYTDYLESINIKSIGKTNQSVIVAYLMQLKNNGKSNATISRNIASLRSFYQYLVKNNKMKNDPTINLEAPKIEKKLPEVLSMSEVNLLLAQPTTNDLKGFRDKAMLEVLYATGMRVSELIALNIQDIDLEKENVKCQDKDKQRIIPIGKTAIKCTKDYLENARSKMIKNPSEESLFINVNGRRLTRQGFWKIIKHYKETAKIQKDITPHMLRHSFAIHLVQNGADAEFVKEMLGHRDISSTNMYFNMAQDTYNITHPRA